MILLKCSLFCRLTPPLSPPRCARTFSPWARRRWRSPGSPRGRCSAPTELRDQATRAAKSAFLNLAEGLPDDRPAVRRRYFRQADGSVHEVVAAVDLAAVIGALDPSVAREATALAARARALLRGLMR